MRDFKYIIIAEFSKNYIFPVKDEFRCFQFDKYTGYTTYFCLYFNKRNAIRFKYSCTINDHHIQGTTTQYIF